MSINRTPELIAELRENADKILRKHAVFCGAREVAD